MHTAPGFEDAYNPTAAELTGWAYDADAKDPVPQDWDVIATRPAFGSLFLGLAADRRCPRRRFFLGCMYLLAGDAIRTKFRTLARRGLTELIAEAEAIGEPWVRSWAGRTRTLLGNPASFDYAAWCDHGLARNPV